MGVYIKGMEMPTKCDECEWSTTDRSGFFGCRLTGNIVIRKREQDRPDWCPIIPVPEHGRLIDAGELQRDIHEHQYVLRDGCNSKDVGMFTCGIDYAISVAPTIIPADPADKEGE